MGLTSSASTSPANGDRPAKSRHESKLAELFGLDLRSLALFRMGMAIVVIADFLIRFGDIGNFYSRTGALPSEAYREFQPDLYWSLNLLSDASAAQVVLFVLAIASAVAMFVGYRTRLATIAVWIFVISIHNRHPYLIFAADDVLRALLFWAMFLPLGAAYSIDAALNTHTDPQPRRILSGATVALTVQVCYIYMFSAAYKSTSPDWSLTGDAVYYAFSYDQYATPISSFLLDFPPILRLATIATLVIEWLGPLLLFVPVYTTAIRTVTVVTFILLHISFGLSFELGIFPALSSLSWLAFLPTGFWAWAQRRTQTSQRDGLQIYYDADCGFCKKVVHLLRTLLVLPKTPLAEAQSDPDIAADMEKHNSWVVVDWQGNRRFKWQAMAYVVSLSPVFGWLAPVLRWSPLMALGTKLYEAIANNRRVAGHFTKPFKFRPFHVRTAWWKDVITLGLLGFTTVWIGKDLAWRTLPPDHTINRQYKRRTAQVLDKFAHATRLDQSWSIFAPGPPRDDGWHVIRGVLADGSVVDVLRDSSGEPSFDKPTIAERNAIYPNMQWRTHFINLNRAIGQQLYPPYADYLCREWNANHSPDQQLQRLEIFFMDERTVPPGETQTVERTLHWEKTCSGVASRPDSTPNASPDSSSTSSTRDRT